MSSQAIVTFQEAEILSRLIQPQGDELSREVAAFLLALRFGEKDVDRMNQLSELSSAGTLTEAEAAELDGYLHVGYLLGIMQAKARKALRTIEGTRPRS